MKRLAIIFIILTLFIGCESKELKQQLSQCQQENKKLKEEIAELKEYKEYNMAKNNHKNLWGITVDLTMYFVDFQKYPANLINLLPNYVDKLKLLDEWENEIVYVPADDFQSYMLISRGPDGKISTADDFIYRGKAYEDTSVDTGIYEFE